MSEFPAEYVAALRRGALLFMAELTDSSLLEIYAELQRRDAILAAAGDSGGSSGASGDADPPLLDAPAVGRLLGMKKAAVYEAARRGEIGSVRASAKSRSGRAVRFTQAQVDAFVAARSVAAKAARSSRLM